MVRIFGWGLVAGVVDHNVDGILAKRFAVLVNKTDANAMRAATEAGNGVLGTAGAAQGLAV